MHDFFEKRGARGPAERPLRRRIASPAVALLALGLAASAGFGETLDGPSIHNSRFVYSTEEKLDFDLEQHLRITAPHLLPHAETIAHGSAYYTVSPRLVLALIELRTGQVSAPEVSGRPFGDLSESGTFSLQIEDVLGRLSALFYAGPEGAGGLRAAPAATEALRALLGSDAEVAGLRASYEALFPDQSSLDEPSPGAVDVGKAVPPPGLLQLPYPVGESWYSSGAHTFDGQDPGPMSSLDFSRNLEPWGANTSNTWVVAAHGGTVVVFSSCFVEVLGPGGWSTSYYHLDNVVVADGQVVGKDQRLSNYADNLAQALCQGGFSTQPHVHFSLRRNGQYVSLQDARLSRYRVRVGRFSYDRDCDYFWYERDGLRLCAGDGPLPNDRGVTPPAAPRDLVARALSSSEIELRWSDRSGNEDGFEVERRSSGGFLKIVTTAAGATGYLDSGLAPGTLYTYRVRATNGAGVSGYTNRAPSSTFFDGPRPCQATSRDLCLNRERFAIEVDWRDHGGNAGRANKVDFSSEDAGLLWFFDADNWEMLIKVLDGCGFNDRFWVFAAATTDVEYTLRVIDSQTGHVATYYNPLGNAAAAITDTAAFATCPP